MGLLNANEGSKEICFRTPYSDLDTASTSFIRMRCFNTLNTIGPQRDVNTCGSFNRLVIALADNVCGRRLLSSQSVMATTSKQDLDSPLLFPAGGKHYWHNTLPAPTDYGV